MNNPYEYNPFGNQNVMGGHAGMPTPMQYNPYAQYYSSPFAPVDTGTYSPGIWEMLTGKGPSNLARNTDMVNEYRQEAMRRTIADWKYSAKGAGLETMRSVGSGALQLLGTAAMFSPIGWKLKGAAFLGTSLASMYGNYKVDELGRGMQGERYEEVLRRHFAGNRGARALGMPYRGRFDTTLPSDLASGMKDVAKEFGIANKDVYEIAMQTFHSGTLSLDGAKKLPERIKEIIKSSVDIAKDLGTTLNEAVKYTSELSARGFHNPAEVSRKMAGSIRKTVNAYDLDSRFVSQMGNIGYQTAMNVGGNPITGQMLFTQMAGPMMSAKETPFFKPGLESVASVGGPEAALSRIGGTILSGLHNPRNHIVRAMASMLESGEDIGSGKAIIERARSNKYYTVGDLTKWQENFMPNLIKYFASSNLQGAALQKAIGVAGLRMGIQRGHDLNNFINMVQHGVVKKAESTPLEGETGDQFVKRVSALGGHSEDEYFRRRFGISLKDSEGKSIPGAEKALEYVRNVFSSRKGADLKKSLTREETAALQAIKRIELTTKQREETGFLFKNTFHLSNVMMERLRKDPSSAEELSENFAKFFGGDSTTAERQLALTKINRKMIGIDMGPFAQQLGNVLNGLTEEQKKLLSNLKQDYLRSEEGITQSAKDDVGLNNIRLSDEKDRKLLERYQKLREEEGEGGVWTSVQRFFNFGETQRVREELRARGVFKGKEILDENVISAALQNNDGEGKKNSDKPSGDGETLNILREALSGADGAMRVIVVNSGESLDAPGR